LETREDLLQQLNETITQLVHVYQNMADSEIVVYEGWTARYVLGHITFWHESFARNVLDIVNDGKPSPLKGTYRDLNQRCFDEIRTQTIEVIIMRLEAAHKVIQENILSTKLKSIPYKKGSRDYSPEEHMDIVHAHIKEHLNDILNVNKKNKQTQQSV
jgi:nucleotidyltransferase/DNA polymerase involved in DNA repair